MSLHISKTALIAAILVSALFFVGIGTYILISRARSLSDMHTFEQQILSAHTLAEKTKTFDTIVKVVGPADGQEFLKALSNKITSNDLHSLNHENGSAAYSDFGLPGLALCKDYFSYSCFHGFIIEAVAEKGFSVVDELMATCLSLPVEQARFGCAHGVGHGILAWIGYKDLPEAIRICKGAANDPGKSHLISDQCYGGVFMENITGTHLGAPSPDRWYKPGDPLYPCDSPAFADEDVKLLCWSVQSQFTLEDGLWFAHDIPASVAFCSTLARGLWQSICLEGISRHIQLYASSTDTTKEISDACEEMGGPYYVACMSMAARSAYFSDNETQSFKLCDTLPEESRSACLEHVSWEIVLAIPEKELRMNECKKFATTTDQKQCETYVVSMLQPPPSPFTSR